MKKHNPKYVQALKEGKADYSVIPWEALHGLVLAMNEGAGKYGRFNFLEDEIEARTYIAAISRHLFGDPNTGSKGWVNGEDIDAESGLHHLDKVMACCVLVRAAELHDKLIDNRLETESKTPPAAQDEKTAHPNPEMEAAFAALDDAADENYARRCEHEFAPGDSDSGQFFCCLKCGRHTPYGSYQRVEREYFVDFVDETGASLAFVKTEGPFPTREAAEAYAKENPENYAGEKSVYRVI